ncbi:autophagy-related protein [Schizophyllum amplum]|uniref:Autophagy-related protein 101 n=1 Tax=Schizophyllum amplum TaxID=97359 RepID=A0A550CGB0_9AGAR|nr:autophagy-related protein [Auriculariopsis ampla]
MTDAHPTITVHLVLDRQNGKDVLTGVLHAILFHRLFGTVKPQTFEVLDITMPGVSDAAMERLVHDKVDTFWRTIEGAAEKRGQLTVTFSEKRPKKSWFQVYVGEEDVAWEQWIVNAELRQPRGERDRQAFDATLASALRKAMMTMLTHTSSEKGRAAVPLITNASGISPFPFRIAGIVAGAEVA